MIRSKNMISEVNSEEVGGVPYLYFLNVVRWLVPGDILIYRKRASQGETQLDGNCLGREGSQWLNLMMQKKRSWREHYKPSKQGEAKGRGFNWVVQRMTSPPLVGRHQSKMGHKGYFQGFWIFFFFLIF